MSGKIVAYALPINPQPWAIGKITTRRNNGKIFGTPTPEPTLIAYQNAVRETLVNQDSIVLPGPYSIRFTFSRRLESFMTPSGQRHQRKQADVTNMQKATEDALQGVLIDNDRNVIHVESDNLKQGNESQPLVVIELKFKVAWEDRHFPYDFTDQASDAIANMLRIQEETEHANNVWRI